MTVFPLVMIASTPRVVLSRHCSTKGSTGLGGSDTFWVVIGGLSWGRVWRAPPSLFRLPLAPDPLLDHVFLEHPVTSNLDAREVSTLGRRVDPRPTSAQPLGHPLDITRFLGRLAHHVSYPRSLIDDSDCIHVLN